MRDEPLQTDEVVEALTGSRVCALVYTSPNGSESSVDISFDDANPRAPWRIMSLCGEIPDKEFLRQVLALGFELRAWPDSSRPVYELSRSCFGVRAAAIKALLIARMLPGIPGDAWLWLTAPERDQRDYPPPGPPSPWPPSDV